jgi:hypothetical protein
MIALTDHQLKIVMDAAAGIDPDRRDVYLQRMTRRISPGHRIQYYRYMQET